jgi:ABC-2 type transport system permease protein
MSWVAVTKKDFQDAARSRWLWALSVLFVLFAAGMAYLYSEIFASAPANELNVLGLLFFLLTPASLLVPIIGLMISYKSVVGERESGSIKLLLSLPHTRRDMVLGKLLGRTASVAVAIAIGFAVAAAVAVVQYGGLDPVAYVLFVLLTMFFALVYISIGVGFSTLFASASRALAGAIGLFVLLEIVWDFVPLVLYYFVNGLSMEGYFPQPPEWVQFLGVLAPSQGYSSAVNALLPENPQASLGGAAAQAPDAFYLQDWFGLVVLLFWLIVPITLGYLRFRSTDL